MLNGCTVKTVLPFPGENPSSSYNSTHHENERKEVRRSINADGVGKGAKGHFDEGNRQNYFEKSLDTDQVSDRCFDLQLVGDNQREELPKLPPVRLKSEDKLVNMNWEDKINHHGSGAKQSSADHAFMIGSYLDVPIGQDITSSGGRRTIGSSWLSVSQGITEDTSGFARLDDDSLEYPIGEYWDSDEYDDDDDVGYTRQPIEDETWFLAHEIDYPSDNEKATDHTRGPDRHDRPTKDEDDDQSFVEEDSYISGEQYFHGKNIAQIGTSEGPMVNGIPDNDMIAQYDGQLLDPEELNLMHSEPAWQGFVLQNSELGMLGNGKFLNDSERPHPDDPFVEDDQHGSVRSIGVGISSDAADIGSEVRESLIGGSSEGDIEYFNESSLSVSGKRHSQQDPEKKRVGAKGVKHDQINYAAGIQKGNLLPGAADGGFSFPPPLHSVKNHDSDTKTLWSKKDEMYCINDLDDCQNGVASDDMLATWKKKNSESSLRSSRDEMTSDVVRSRNSSPSYGETEDTTNVRRHKLDDAQEDTGTNLDDEEAAALQEQVRQIKVQEEEFETFNLKIVHRKNRTGFEEDKNFHVVLNSVIAGRYHVSEYLGSAAFSKAIQAHDLHTGMDVCVKIIKNNKDFFDQSLDEIKLLKYVNKHDPGDKYHLLRLYDYFYYREHLLIVCELLKANLYEFQKFNRESGGEVYFTMPRLQSIAIQCLEALQFLHGLGLIHCDLKPENILVKSYSRCEIKVIDLGSSCFETDHLCSYVQSRSYRAPEVILGLPYDKKIDIWSLGCILAELCTGNVLFQNDSPATLLARVMGIIGAIEQAMLAQGRDTFKYFTKNHMLYERNQESNRLEYLIPKKTSLRYRLPMADQGFIEFVACLLEVNPKKRPSASEALKHPWLSFPYEPISS
ncbi:Protein kinase superfamily protein [Zea mays]|nr:Protein kinase superfamily protein [Zea mays]